MKLLAPQASIRGMTLLEVLLVLFTIAVMAAIFLPAINRPPKSNLVLCISHLKRTSLGFIMYADDNDEKFPMQMPVARGGPKDFINGGNTFPQFQKLQKYVPNPGNFICPLDTARLAATNYASLTDLNLSYFLNLDAATNNPAHTILAGDRFLQADGRLVGSGWFLLTSNVNLSWSPDYHHARGILAFADGHVDVTTSHTLTSAIQNQPLATNRLSIP